MWNPSKRNLLKLAPMLHHGKWKNYQSAPTTIICAAGKAYTLYVFCRFPSGGPAPTCLQKILLSPLLKARQRSAEVGSAAAILPTCGVQLCPSHLNLARAYLEGPPQTHATSQGGRPRCEPQQLMSDTPPEDQEGGSLLIKSSLNCCIQLFLINQPVNVRREVYSKTCL